jgi:hypothetical protein
MPIIVLISIPVIIGFLALAGAFSTGQVQIPTGFWMLVKGGGFALVVACTLSMIVRAASETAQIFKAAGKTLKYVSVRMPIADHSHKIPEFDHSGAVIAYRYFDVEDGELHSVGYGATGHNPVTKRSKGSYAGGWNIADRVPTLNNTHGIYAAKTPNSPILDDYNILGSVLAKVELSGRVVEGEYGYRAQYCRVLEVYGD